MRRIVFVAIIVSLLPRCVFSADNAEEQKVRQRDIANVKRMQEYLMTKYVGTVAVTGEYNADMKEYVDELLEPLRQLVNHGRLPRSLGMQQFAGPTGAAKSAVATDFVEMAKAFGFLQPRRVVYQQGSEKRTLDLSIIDELGVKESELLKGDDYLSVRSRYVQTAAFIHSDEASDFAAPPANIDAAEAAELREMHAKFRARHEAMRAEGQLGPEPTRPTETDPEKLMEFELKYLEWKAKKAELGKIGGETVEQAVDAIKRKYDRHRIEAMARGRVMAKFWQASSGGRFFESELAERVDTDKLAVEAAAQSINDFKARYMHEHVFKEVDEKRGEIRELFGQLQRKGEELDRINAEIAAVREKLNRFKGAQGNSVEAWLGKNGLRLEAKRTRDGEGVPGFVDRMVDELSKKEDFFYADMVGHEKKDVKSKDIEKLLEHIEGSYERRLRDLEAQRGAKSAEITSVRNATERLKNQLTAFVRTQEDKGLSGWATQMKEWDRLEEHYANVIREASKSASARFEIDKFFENMTVEKLRTEFPTYFKRLVDLGKDVATHLTYLKKSKDSALKFDEMLLMDRNKATALVHEAATKIGFQTDPEYFGGVRWISTMNIIELEQSVHREVKERRAKGEEITHEMYREIYERHLKGREKDSGKSWAKAFFQKFWPGFFKEQNGNPAAEERRVSAPGGARFILPPTTGQLVNSVATTMRSEFEEWKRHMQAEGFDVGGELYIHPSAAVSFVTSELQPERGMNAVLDSVRKSMSKLLLKLTEQAVNKRVAAGGPTPFHVKLGIFNEVAPGNQQRITLRALDPGFTQADPVLRTVPAMGQGSVIETDAHTRVTAPHLKQTIDSPALTVAEGAEQIPLTAAEKKTVDDARAAEVKKTDEATKANEETIRRTDLALKLKKLIAERPNLAAMKAFNATVDERDRWFVGERLLTWSRDKLNGANATHLYQWLAAEVESARSVDSFLQTNFPEIRKLSSYSLGMMFAQFVHDDGLLKNLSRLARPGVTKRSVRALACLVGLGGLTGIKLKIQ